MRTRPKGQLMAISTAARLLTLIALLGLGTQRASAETIMFSFTGTVTSVNPDTIGAIGGTDVVDVGDTITGSFVYDLDAPGTVGGTGPGGIVISMFYQTPVPPGRLTYAVGGLTVNSEPFVVVVGNSIFSRRDILVDTFVIGASSSIPVPLETAFRLEDASQTVFSDTNLPTKIKVHDFDLRQIEVYIINSGFAFPLFVTSVEQMRRHKHPH